MSEQRPQAPAVGIAQSRGAAAVLNLLLPGLGHVYWKEWAFGVFIFLVMLIALILLVVSLLYKIPVAARWLLYSLPLVFYLFTFIDLSRTMTIKRRTLTHSNRRLLVFLAAGLVYQVAIPVAPVNFVLRNAPGVFVMENNNFSPMFRKGDILKASSLAYTMDFFFLSKPAFYALPQRYDVVRYHDGTGRAHTALVIGLPGEDVEISGGVLTVNGLPDVGVVGFPFSGECPLTSVDSYSILVVTFRLSAIDRVQEVPLTDLIGKVGRIW